MIAMPLPQTFSLLVLGLGSTGFNVIEWALRHQGERVSAVCVYGGASAEPNESTRALEKQGVRFVFGTESVEGSYDVCVASPGISEFSEFYRSARAASTQIMGEPEFAYRLSPERWCGITGTNGKTTTTALVEHLIRSSGMAATAVGNIGTATISAVDSRSPGDWLVVFVALASLYGHIFSPYLHFHGGKGIATGVGILFGYFWPLALVHLGIFIVLVALTRYVSLGSIVTAGLVPLTMYLAFPSMGAGALALWALLGWTVVWAHRSNIRRLRAGKESKLSFSKRVTTKDDD